MVPLCIPLEVPPPLIIIHVATLLQKHVHEWLIIVVDSLAHHYTSFTGRVDYIQLIINVKICCLFLDTVCVLLLLVTEYITCKYYQSVIRIQSVHAVSYIVVLNTLIDTVSVIECTNNTCTIDQ